jgi:hypothetical protein
MKNITLLLLAAILVASGIVIGYQLGADENEIKRDIEMKGYHKRYLQVYPFEGDQSYEDFDFIFDHQDDEFYQMYN